MDTLQLNSRDSAVIDAIDSLVVKGGKPVPADESGLNAFIKEKILQIQ